MKIINTLVALVVMVMASSSIGAERLRRLPSGYHQGRCFYEVDHKQRIAERCFYKRSKDGWLSIDGARQSFGGVDTVDLGSDARTYSRDWWVEVFPSKNVWSGYGNESVPDVHGGSPWSLRRRGACFLGDSVKICLWRY